MNIREIAKAKGVSIDSRTIKKGEIFIAIKGKNYDGHHFIAEAVKKGAAGIVASLRFSGAIPVPSIKVIDTVKALGDMAAVHRKKFDIPVIGITGSNGKTTVKEMAAHILGAKFNVLKNRGTENNLIGLPLTLLRLRPTHRAAVLEMGANHTGEIERLSQILRPTLGIITNIGPSHLEYFGDLKTVLKAKSEILNYLPKGRIILNGDDGFLAGLHRSLRPVTFGMQAKNDFRADNITEKRRKLEFNLNNKLRFHMKMAGRHNIQNGLAAIAIGSILGISLNTIRERLATIRPLDMRMRIGLIRGIHIIDDTYNSNPLSARWAIEFLSAFKTKGRKIFVTGDMLELGERSRHFHREMGRLAAGALLNKLITVGKLSRQTLMGARKFGIDPKSSWNCESTGKAASLLADIARPGDAVLVKGSRAMRMEDIIKKLKIKN